MKDVSATLTQFYKSRKVLVTGGASFIGSYLTELLVKAGAKVTVADDLSSGKLANLYTVKKQIKFLEADLHIEKESKAAAKGQEIVFHLAAAHGGRGYIETHPVECTGNMKLDHTVFSAAANAGAKKIVFTSSACVYPTTLQSANARKLLGEQDAGFDEIGKAFADGEYGWAKLIGELQLRAFHKQYKISGVACRIFTAYGERENETHAVIALIAKALLKLDPFPIWGDGKQTRNFTYVQDTVTGLALAGAKLEGFQAINVGTAQHHTILDLLEVIFAELGWRPTKIQPELDKPVGVGSRAANNERCAKLLGWEPGFPLKEGVARTINWYKTEFDASSAKFLDHLLLERGALTAPSKKAA